VTGAVWPDLLSSAERAALDPGVPTPWPATPDVLVVGGGVVGLAVAAACQRAGVGSVLVVERDRLGAGASGGAAGLLTPEPHVWTDPPALVDLGRASLARYRRLDAECNGALGVRNLDALIVLPVMPPPSLVVSAGVELLTADAAVAVEPALGDPVAALLVHDQAHVNPLRVAAALARRAGTIATGVTMTAVEANGSRTRVCTSAGDVSPGAVVFATGDAPDLVAVPQRWVKGHMLATAPAPFPLGVVVLGTTGVVPLPDGRLVVGGTLDLGDASLDVRPDVADALRADLIGLVPAAAELEVTHRWCCFRPATADDLPVVDRVPGLDDAWVTAGHYRTGVLMAPATGDALASWIATGARPSGVEAFGLERFTGL